jgi:hypothetical protein
MRSQNIKIFVLSIIIAFALPFLSNAATLFVSPESKDVKVGDIFSVLVNTDSQGVAINAATADIAFDNNLLSVQSIGFSSSIFSIWPEEPSYSNTTANIHFSGGLYSPGWSGGVGAILRVTFKAKAVGQAKLAVANASVLANDGIGTNVLTNSLGSSIKISKALPAVTEIVPTKPGIVATSTVEKIEELFTTPVIVNIPEELTEGSLLSFSGNGISDGQVFVYIQKGKNSPEITQIDTKSSGVFDYTYHSPVKTGYYKIWARNISTGGVMSTSSDISYVEVLGVSGYIINNYLVTFSKVIYLMIAVCVTLLVLWLFTLFFYLKNKKEALNIKKNRKERKIKGSNVI